VDFIRGGCHQTVSGEKITMGQSEESIVRDRLMLELEVNNNSEIFLALTGDKVSARPIGGPRVLGFVDYIRENSENDADPFTSRRNAIYDYAPSAANGYATAYGDVEWVLNYCLNDSRFNFPIQYYYIEKDSLRKAFDKVIEGMGECE
jgi:hypothetical protein